MDGRLADTTLIMTGELHANPVELDRLLRCVWDVRDKRKLRIPELIMSNLRPAGSLSV